jgi:hypothetical protein
MTDTDSKEKSASLQNDQISNEVAESTDLFGPEEQKKLVRKIDLQSVLSPAQLMPAGADCIPASSLYCLPRMDFNIWIKPVSPTAPFSASPHNWCVLSASQSLPPARR